MGRLAGPGFERIVQQRGNTLPQRIVALAGDAQELGALGGRQIEGGTEDLLGSELQVFICKFVPSPESHTELACLAAARHRISSGW